MEILHTDDGKKGEFRAVEDKTEAGLMTYVWAGEDKFIIDHTIGNPAFKGIGTQLLEKAVGFARKKGVKILPLCPFAKKMMERNESMHDVLA